MHPRPICVDCGAPATKTVTAPDGDDFETRRWVKLPLCDVCYAADWDLADPDPGEGAPGTTPASPLERRSNRAQK